MSNVDFIFPVFTKALIPFFVALSTASMIAEAMISWSLRFLASLCTYSILLTLEPFYFLRDSL
jgi:hypothetical protein